MASQEDEDAVKAVLIQRIGGIKNKDPQSIAEIVDKESYTKFDDWPPFECQDLSALKREKQGLKVRHRKCMHVTVLVILESNLLSFFLQIEEGDLILFVVGNNKLYLEKGNTTHPS